MKRLKIQAEDKLRGKHPGALLVSAALKVNLDDRLERSISMVYFIWLIPASALTLAGRRGMKF